MAELIANRYASALFEAGKDLNKNKELYPEVEMLGKIFKNDENLLGFLNHPKVSKDEKKELIENIFEDKISQELMNFIYILIDKNRENLFAEMAEKYEKLYYDDEGIVKVSATTATPMREEAKNRLRDVLAEKLNKDIELSSEIDEDLIGGVKLEMEGKLIDGTVKGKLNSMARALKVATN